MLVRTLLASTASKLGERIETLLDSRDVTLTRARSRDDVWRILQREEIDLLLLDEALGVGSTEDWISTIRELPEAPDLIILTQKEDPRYRAALLALGSLAVLNTRLKDRELRGTLRTLIQRLSQTTSARLTARTEDRWRGFGDLVARSAPMAEVVSVAKQVAESESSVLILGETGVGKERMARTIHAGSARANHPFVPVNCGAIPEGLLESELFGHDQGAFTGAVRARRGHFEMAHNGTLFLDEIGELPSHVQVKLLRVLDDRRIQRLGSEHSDRVNVRILAATNRDLEAEVAAHRFRPDLYYRLAVVTLTIPPLRDRVADIPELAKYHLARIRRTLSKPVGGITAPAMEALCAYAWPGNVRELINVLERTVLLAAGADVDVTDLPPSIGNSRIQDGGRRGGGGRGQGGADSCPAEWIDLPLGEARRRAVEAFEHQDLSALLTRTRGRVGQAAALAGVTPRALHTRLKGLGIRKEGFR